MALTARSQPRPDCTRCKGSGIVSVWKDPDEIADCACTDPVEATPTIAGVAVAALGIELMPWQREFLDRVVRDV